MPYWITFNEPNLLLGGYLKPWWDEKYAAPPGLPEGATTTEQVDAVGKLIRNLFLANKKAYEIIRQKIRMLRWASISTFTVCLRGCRDLSIETHRP